MRDIREKREREKRIVTQMIELYCRKKHGGRELCQECRELAEYARQRSDRCPFMENKTFCSNCKVHCYTPQMRQKIKEVMPDAFIGVDVIVGTRGETPEYFEQAYQFIDGLDVTQLHVFSYSERPGTQALKIEYVVSPEEKHQRSQRLLALSDQKTQAFYARHIGQTMPVLMEKSKAGAPMHGFTENYIRVEVESDDSLDNQVVNVRLGEFNEEMTALKGTILI